MMNRALEELFLYEKRALNTKQILCKRKQGEHCIELESTHLISTPILELYFEEIKGLDTDCDCLECRCTGFDGENITNLRICADTTHCNNGDCL